MAFMRPIVYHGEYYLVDGPHGTDLIPADCIGDLWINSEYPIVGDTEELARLYPKVRDFTDNREVWSIEKVSGCYGRYSAPGYMDRTDWHWADTEAELIAELTQAYGDDDDV